MKANLLDLYHRLPPRARSIAASIKGARLKAWRYGEDTPRWIAEALERESWSGERWKAWQEERAARLLARAVAVVPYYRRHWEERRRRGDRSSREVLTNWPVLRKEAVRSDPRSFLAEDRDARGMSREKTSGTTGTPLTILVPRESLRRHYALFEARIRLWNGVSRRDPWAILGGQLVVPASRTTPPFWVVNHAMNQLYLSAQHLSPASALAYAQALSRHAATHMIAYTSSATVLSHAILDGGHPAPRLRVVIGNAEGLPESSRRSIAQAFGCPVRNTYGMAEMAAAASECREGAMHVWPEEGCVEILRDGEDTPAGEGETGRLVVTGLLNADFPLIRYETGDRGRLRREASCPCGRSLPVLETLEGRSQDLVTTRDGRRIFWLNPIFYGLPVRQAQVVQETLDRIRVIVVPGALFAPAVAAEIGARLKARVGELEVIVETAPEIPKTAAGKVRPVVSLVAGGGARA